MMLMLLSMHVMGCSDDDNCSGITEYCNAEGECKDKNCYDIFLNPSESDRYYSSTFGNVENGHMWASSMLDGIEAWVSPYTDFSNEWIEIDAGEDFSINGLIVQGRDNSAFDQHVTSAKIYYSTESVRPVVTWTQLSNSYDVDNVFLTGLTNQYDK